MLQFLEPKILGSDNLKMRKRAGAIEFAQKILFLLLFVVSNDWLMQSPDLLHFQILDLYKMTTKKSQ